MLIQKFGGTSVGSAQRMKEVFQLINDGERKIVVLSAMSGTTNALVEIAAYLHNKNVEAANECISSLEKRYLLVVDELLASPEFLKRGKELIAYHFDFIRAFGVDMFTIHEEKAILAQGEYLSTALFHFYASEQGADAVLLPATDFMRIDEHEEPDMAYLSRELNPILEEQSSTKIFITQGFICRNAYGEIDNLKRGGSDYSASLIGAAVMAQEIQIWTDIDGMHNNDPRIVNGTKPIANLSFDEAAELAYFGAKILHPSSVLPAKIKNIPVRLKNTMEPEAYGTLISDQLAESASIIKAVAAKDQITAVKIKSGRMLLAYGFLRKVFEVFETYKTPIDMITTSEVAVSLTIDNDKFLPEICAELQKFGVVEVDRDLSIVCVVGNFIAEQKGYAKQIFSALEHIPIRMISYGGSFHNISILVNSEHKNEALKSVFTQLQSAH
jgi:aspartate kinase